ncbi:MAG: purine-nucleoside phosphorylase [Alphaproteobacteria bacterium]
MSTATDIIAQRIGERRVAVGLVLGTGLGPLADRAVDAVSIPYSDLPGFPDAAVSGHAGALTIGTIEGVAVAIFQGREHYYENGRADAMRVPLEALQALGAKCLILTNSAGSLNPGTGPGAPMLITDHINFAGANPLIGEAGDARFVDLAGAYDQGLCARLQKVADQEGITLAKGTYMWFSGPSFETPAEIRAARVLGADAVGMSTVPETIIARRLGLKVAAISMITNLAAGMSDVALSHAQTKKVAVTGAEKIEGLVAGLIKSLGTAPLD